MHQRQKVRGASLLVCTLVSLASIAGGGCRGVTTFVGALACQGVSRPVDAERATGWTFRGLSVRIPPRIRPGTYASATAGVRFLDVTDLGPHGYWYTWTEKNGIVYTCRGGHVDVAHVRKAADWTGYLAALTLNHLEKDQTQFTFKLREPSRYHVTLALPCDWHQLSPAARQTAARAFAIELGQYLAFTAMTWHEILTWFGYRPKGYETDFPSAFSWEDTYSNLLGTRVAAEALRDRGRDFSEAVTAALTEEIQALDPQPGDQARRLTQQLRGSWFCKKHLIITDIRKRNLDLGYGDGLVSPTLIAGVPACEGVPARLLPVPAVAALAEHGFSVDVQIEPREWERDRIWAIIDAEGDRRARRLDPETDFPPLMAYIADEAIRRYALSLQTDFQPADQAPGETEELAVSPESGYIDAQ